MEGFAQDLGLDTGRFSACMEARTYDGVIQRDINLALRNEVSVTPTIFVLSTDPNQTGTKYDGSPSFEEISAVIDELLATPVPTPAPTPTPTAIPVPTSTPPPCLCLRPSLRHPPQLLPQSPPPHQLQPRHPHQLPIQPPRLCRTRSRGHGMSSDPRMRPLHWRNSATFNEAFAGIGPLDRPKR